MARKAKKTKKSSSSNVDPVAKLELAIAKLELKIKQAHQKNLASAKKALQKSKDKSAKVNQQLKNAQDKLKLAAQKTKTKKTASTEKQLAAAQSKVAALKETFAQAKLASQELSSEVADNKEELKIVMDLEKIAREAGSKTAVSAQGKKKGTAAKTKSAKKADSVDTKPARTSKPAKVAKQDAADSKTKRASKKKTTKKATKSAISAPPEEEQVDAELAPMVETQIAAQAVEAVVENTPINDEATESTEQMSFDGNLFEPSSEDAADADRSEGIDDAGSDLQAANESQESVEPVATPPEQIGNEPAAVEANAEEYDTPTLPAETGDITPTAETSAEQAFAAGETVDIPTEEGDEETDIDAAPPKPVTGSLFDPSPDL